VLESELINAFMTFNLNTKVVTETQVAVIGAGVIGCSIAYYLARRGASVIVIESNDIGAGVSSATLGQVWVQRKEPAEYMELNLLSSKLHAELAKTFDEDVELRQYGGLSIYLDEASFQKQLGCMERLNQTSENHQARALTPVQARELEPDISSDIVGAIFGPHDGEVNPIKLVFNLARNARKLGVSFLTHTPANRVNRDEGGVTGVDTPLGFICAKAVVVTAGINSAQLVEMLGIDMPMVSERGQILVTEAIRKVLRYPADNTRQMERGNILLGTTYETNIVDKTTSIEGTKKIAIDSVRRFPVLKNVNIIRHFAGVRALPKDGKPYLGAVKQIPGLYVATSHSGITLAPVHGKVISELIMDGKTDIPLENYRPDRFSL
jgi:glycine/D-amino acid oxidase-like deaminating enzyme